MPDSTATRLPDILIRNDAGEGNPVRSVALRDWFAAMALPALIKPATNTESEIASVVAKAYQVADAMLAQRTKG